MRSNNTVILLGSHMLPTQHGTIHGDIAKKPLEMAQNIILYTAPGSCGLVPQTLLHHCNISFKPIGVSLQNLAELSSKNPKGQVPVFDWNGELITEVPAIAHAINHLAPEGKILGRSPVEFVRVCEWMNFLSASIHSQPWGAFVRPFRFTDEPEAEPGVKRKAKQRLQERLALMESKLPADGWVVGEGFTAVDAYCLAISQWVVARTDLDFKGDFPKWAALVDRAHKVEAVQKALAEEKQLAEELNKA
ncbi:uncharacterized protein LTR77_010397 [Saxophila tyrrhenica]|uniref:Glutathione S-transferase n=1 Tax=Saxophila tyrrhenica TaxID=1690608 RepID=A0AAV9NZA0_9PEZI|nr:hypothetical protein LTR77_010397 [Saxophila tyrrhenica]